MNLQLQQQRGQIAGDGEFETMRGRAAPHIYILDDTLRVVLASPPEEDAPCDGRIIRHEAGTMRVAPAAALAVRRLVARCAAGEHDASLVTIVHPETVIRIARLDGAAGTYVAMFVERFAIRDALRGARERLGLSRREFDVLGQLVQGNTTTEIAEALIISEATVQHHVKSIARKAKARNRAQIVAHALGAGLRDTRERALPFEA